MQTHQLTGDTWRAVRRYMELDAVAKGRMLLGSRKNGRLTPNPMPVRAMQKRIATLGERELEIIGLSPHDCQSGGEVVHTVVFPQGRDV